MSLEQKINYQLNKYPGVKKVVKSVYQHVMYAISPKIRSEGNITRISPDDSDHEYFFGYYDKSPWDASDRYMLCMRAKDTWSEESPREKADILIIDTALPEKTAGQALPDATAVWKADLESGEVTPLLTYKDFASFQPRPEMLEAGAVHKVNHLMFSPGGKRFIVLYRWFIGERKYTRLITCIVDGTDMYVLSDDDMVSHCFWKDDRFILAFENKKDGGPGYYLMKDKTQEYRHCWPELTGDGHPGYNPDRTCIVTDSYPDRARIQYLRVMKNEKAKPRLVAKVFSPFKYDNDTRCDLHPRWNHAGDEICIDSVFEGHRGLYTVALSRKGWNQGKESGK